MNKRYRLSVQCTRRSFVQSAAAIAFAPWIGPFRVYFTPCSQPTGWHQAVLV